MNRAVHLPDRLTLEALHIVSKKCSLSWHKMAKKECFHSLKDNGS